MHAEDAHHEVLHVKVLAQRRESDGVHEADEVDKGVPEPVVGVDLLLRRTDGGHGGAVKLQRHHDGVGELRRHLLQLRAPLPVPAVAQVAPAPRRSVLAKTVKEDDV